MPNNQPTENQSGYNLPGEEVADFRNPENYAPAKNEALNQAQPPTPAGRSANRTVVAVLIIIGILVVFYFVVYRPVTSPRMPVMPPNFGAPAV